MELKVLFRREGAAGHIQLNKPAKLNALDEDVLTAVERQIGNWEREGAVSVVALSSSNAKAFCVGADLEVLATFDEAAMRAWELMGNRVLDRLQRSALISVAVLQGHVHGGGLTLAAACDFRIAAPDVLLSQPEIGLGWIPGWGGVARLARLTGAARAKELCITGRRIGAEEALHFGLLDQVLLHDGFAASAAGFIESLAAKSRPALEAIKHLADASFVPAAPASASFDALVNASLLRDPRGQAAIQAFLARKKS
jgi:enoyl-CoA hydratase/carnithine racemase